MYGTTVTNRMSKRFYHVTSRSNERKDVFISQTDRERYFSYLGSVTELYGRELRERYYMQNTMKQLLKDWLPPVLIKWICRIRHKSFVGPFESWNDAQEQSLGYNSDIILRKCKNAMLKIVSGEAVYERDSVVFDKIQHSFPVLAGLLHAVNVHVGRVSVLDFGGSLGSSYYQCRSFLPGLKSLRWSIVEQPKFVECGREFFETEQLKFYYDIDECLNSEKPELVLLSGVLEYIERPYDLMKDIVARNFQYIILDRTPVVELESDILTVQKVPKEIYEASFPCRFISEKQLLSCFAIQYEILGEWESFETCVLGRIRAQSKGYIFKNVSMS